MPESMPAVAVPTNRNTPVPPSRVGRSQLGVYVHPQLAKSIKLLSVKQGRTVQAVMIEALNDVLRKHGETPIGNGS